MDLNQYKGVSIFAEQRDGVLSKVTMELLGKGRELADKLKVPLSAVLVGKKVQALVDELYGYGAEIVYLAEHEELLRYRSDTYTSAVFKCVEMLKPEIFLVGATSIGRDLAPRLAGRLGTGLTADCTGLDVDEKGHLMQTRPAFGGNIIATIATPEHRPQMASVRARVMDAKPFEEGRSGKCVTVEYEPQEKDLRVTVNQVLQMAKSTKKIEDANILVAAGRGIGDADGLKLIQQLAKVLGGEVAASRDIVDAGWIEHEYQVGQTGKTVRPSLYIACGISGAVQHTAGMKNADYILAINTNPDADIFKVADYGIVGDLYQVIPEMIAAIKESKEL